MNVLRINPYIRYARQHTMNYSNKTTKLCYDCRFFYIEKGVGTIKVNGRKYNFSNGTTMFLPAGSAYSFEYNTQDIKIYVVNFDFTEEFSYIADSLGTPSYISHEKEKIVRCQYPAEFSEFMIKGKLNVVQNLEKICDLYLTQQPYYKETASAILKLCLVDFLKKNTDNKNSALSNDILNFIYEHYKEIDLTNNRIAEIFGYHPYYLNNIVKASTGKTLHKHIMDYRLSVAMNYLVTTVWDVNTIAWKSGFGTVSYFIKSFKEKTGMTPHKYRNEYMTF